VQSSGCFPAQGLVFSIDLSFWFYNLARPDFLCLSHLCVDAARVLCASPFFLAKVSRSGIPIPVSRCVERFTDLYFLINFQSSYSSNRSKHLVDSVRSSVSVASRPSLIHSSKVTPLFAVECQALVLIGTEPFPNSVLDDFSVCSGEPMDRPGARALGLGLHNRLPVQIQLLYLRSMFGREFLL
jgi:hypothetical protein